MTYELLLFDADDTLFDYSKGEAAAMEKTFNIFELSFDAEIHLPAYQIHNLKVWQLLEENKISPEELKIERFRNLFQEFDITTDPELFSKTYLEKLAESHHLFEGVEDVIKKIAPKFKLAVITNGLKEVQTKRIALSAISQHIEHVIISEDVGIAKPAPEIFEYAFNVTGHENKSKALMIGDNLKSDILGGLNFGIDTCWFNFRNIENKTGIKPKYEITSISQILEIIAN